jgi:hypothetical protein
MAMEEREESVPQFGVHPVEQETLQQIIESQRSSNQLQK